MVFAIFGSHNGFAEGELEPVGLGMEMGLIDRDGASGQ